jgi:3-deoxy-D-arabino-heptulosonate 7-phosphate (DAHP) synthase class II
MEQRMVGKVVINQDPEGDLEVFYDSSADALWIGRRLVAEMHQVELRALVAQSLHLFSFPATRLLPDLVLVIAVVIAANLLEAPQWGVFLAFAAVLGASTLRMLWLANRQMSLLQQKVAEVVGDSEILIQAGQKVERLSRQSPCDTGS